MARAEELAPDNMREPRIQLTLADPGAPLNAGVPIVINVDYSLAEPDGVRLPLILTISSGRSRSSFRRHFFQRVLPSVISFTPVEGGRHLVRLAEVYAQQWSGIIRLDVFGDRLEPGTE